MSRKVVSSAHYTWRQRIDVEPRRQRAHAFVGWDGPICGKADDSVGLWGPVTNRPGGRPPRCCACCRKVNAGSEGR